MHRLARGSETCLRSANCAVRAAYEEVAGGSLCVHDSRRQRWLRWAGTSRIDGADLQSRRSARDRAPGNDRRLSHLSGPVQPRVFPYVEREAHQTGCVRAVRSVAGKLHVAAVAVRRLHVVLRRSDACAQRPRLRASDYFTLLGKTIGGVLRGSGRLKQSVAESSFDAWVKYYRQDENAANAIVSYYQKGSLVALAFDLSIRAQTDRPANRSTM